MRIAQWPLRTALTFQHADRLSHGTSADALNGLGETIIYENDTSRVAEAAALFDRALKLDPHSPQALFYTAVSALNAGNLQLARSALREPPRLGPAAQCCRGPGQADRRNRCTHCPASRDLATSIHLRVTLAPVVVAQPPEAGHASCSRPRDPRRAARRSPSNG